MAMITVFLDVMSEKHDRDKIEIFSDDDDLTYLQLQGIKRLTQVGLIIQPSTYYITEIIN